MIYALSSHSSIQRSGLLGIVIGLHVAVIALIVTAKTVAPQIMEMPLMVNFVDMERAPEAKPVTVAKPQPVYKTAPKTAAPKLQTTSSEEPAPAAPVAPAPEPMPAPPAAPVATVVSQARFDADYLRNPPPPYPPLSRRMGEEGQVILRVAVTPQGTADSVEIRTSSGSERLDVAAQKTVRNWKFIPAKRGEIAVQSWVVVPIIFKLEQ